MVSAAMLDDGSAVAAKFRRTDSKRQSLEGEGRLLEVASRAGASPRPLFYFSDIIVMEYVGMMSLGRLMAEAPSPLIAEAMLEAIRAARALDLAEVLHAELHRPLRNIFFPAWPYSLKAEVIDLESASRGCGNVNKVLSFLVSRGLIKADKDLDFKLRDYRSLGCPQGLYKDLEKAVTQALKASILLNDLA
ncbi:MAG: hypothetical protein ACP5HK_04910 [Acidilobus sp.]